MSEDQDHYSSSWENDADTGKAQDESEEVQKNDYLGYSALRASSGDRRSSGHLWLISYSDFMTILMIFFLAMYAYAVLARAALSEQTNVESEYSVLSESVDKLKDEFGQGIEMAEEQDRVTLNLKDKILFPSGSAKLTTRAIRTLEELANSIMLVRGDVIVQGHTDDIPIKSDMFQSNWELSAARSFSVIQALSVGGVDQKRLIAMGFGEHRSIVPNLDWKSRSQNRRIEIVVLKNKEKEK